MNGDFKYKVEFLLELIKAAETEACKYLFAVSGDISGNIFRRPEDHNGQLDKYEPGRYIAFDHTGEYSYAIAFGTDLKTDENKPIEGFKFDGSRADYMEGAQMIINWLVDGTLPNNRLN